jgi:hypothetical protein
LPYSIQTGSMTTRGLSVCDSMYTKNQKCPTALLFVTLYINRDTIKYMKNNLTLIIAVVCVIAIGLFIYYKETKSVPEPVVTEVESLIGCYQTHYAKDVYSLSINRPEREQFEGTLVFDNFEKDSSSGTYVGIYTNGILLGYYSFQSEGMDSVMQVIFKKTDTGFVRGYGSYNEDGTEFIDLNDITYDPVATFEKTDAVCPSSTR